jgi:uncharacterized membrane protein
MLQTIVLIFHVLGAGVLFSTGIFSLLVTTRKPVSKERLRTMELFEKCAPIAAMLQLVTGLILYVQNAEAFNINPIFWVKISLYILSGFLAVRIVKRKRTALLQQAGKTVKVGNYPVWTIVEIVVLLAIITCGVILVESV